MDILFYQYGSICEPDVLSAFEKMGFSVHSCDAEVYNKHMTTEQRLNAVSKILCAHPIQFIFSINFFPFLSEICKKLGLLYVCWSVDCPVLELFSNSVHNECNRIFLFDYNQYLTIHPQNPDCIFYLPLATNVTRWDELLQNISKDDIQKYSSDISFVGSLYHEKSPLSPLYGTDSAPSPNPISLPEFWMGYVDGLCNSQLKVYGYNFLEDAISPEFIAELKKHFPDFYKPENTFTDTDAYVAANYYLGMHVSEQERIRVLNTLAVSHHVTVYTRSNTSLLEGVDCRGGVSTHAEMPKIFHCSKINLNITIKSIQSGLSLRVWDVLGCGGFLLTNYQTEIPEYFEIGKDLDCYESMADLKAKAAYYLKHDDIRKEIAESGYSKIKQFHTYEARIAAMLKIVFKQS